MGMDRVMIMLFDISPPLYIGITSDHEEKYPGKSYSEQNNGEGNFSIMLLLLCTSYILSLPLGIAYTRREAL